MNQPSDIPQDIWDKSIALMQGIPADFSWDGFEDAKSNHACAAEEVARAIMAAKAEEREEIAEFCAIQAPTVVGQAFAAAIRKREEG